MSRATLVLALVAAAAEMIGAETAPSCLAYRSFETPVPQPNLKNCPQFRDMSCCNEDVDSLIIPNENGTQLYGFDWSQCGQLSPACQKFFQAESCYFECDPYMAPWKDRTSANPVAVVNVPVCADYCGAWFEACKNDLTCGDEWMVDFIPHENSEGEVVSYECAPGSQCKTFKDVFHNAQGLCDILWGAAFHYSEDLDNCVRWDFGLTTSNPNRFVEKVDYTQSYCGPKLEPLPEEPPKRSKVEPSCMPGKDLDTPASVKLKECPHFRDEACCSVETDAKIGHKDQDELFFGYNWDQCGPISDKCKRFFQAEACYFHCDPYNYQWANPTVAEPSTYIGVPVCADYCDEWYDACKEEMTCATEWIIGLAPQKNGNGDIVGYECAEGSECKSFAEVFENPRGMCELMWGSYYHYSEDPDNCVRFDFEGKNPNQFVHQTTYSSGSCMMKEVKERNTAAIALGVVLAITFVVLGLFIIFMIFREKASRPLFGSSK